VQFGLTVLQAVFWHVVSIIGPVMFAKWFNTKPYKDMVVNKWQEVMKGIGIDMTYQSCEESLHDTYGCSTVHHAVLGALCLPRVLGMPGISIALSSALVCHASLGELGHEIEETITIIRDYVVDPARAREKHHPMMLLFLATHHVMGFTIAIPLNMFYPQYYHYAHGLFQLHFATAVSSFVQFYVWSSTLETARDLLKMKACVTIGFAAAMYGRGIGYLWTFYQMVMQFYADGATMFLLGGTFAGVMMLVINVAMLNDATKEFIKVFSMSFEEQDTATLQRSLSRAASSFSLGHARLTTSKKGWAKVRGAVLLGTFKEKAKKI